MLRRLRIKVNARTLGKLLTDLYEPIIGDKLTALELHSVDDKNFLVNLSRYQVKQLNKKLQTKTIQSEYEVP